jgi:hypothetical protein
MQTEIDWELKEAKKVLSMSNQSAIKGGITITEIERSMGLLEHIKTSDELITHINGNRNRCKDWAYEGMDKLTGTTQTPYKAIPSETKNEMGTATDKQRKAVWAIIHGTNGNKGLEKELPDTIDNLSFEQASDFIEQYGFKK